MTTFNRIPFATKNRFLGYIEFGDQFCVFLVPSIQVYIPIDGTDILDFHIENIRALASNDPGNVTSFLHGLRYGENVIRWALERLGDRSNQDERDLTLEEVQIIANMVTRSVFATREQEVLADKDLLMS